MHNGHPAYTGVQLGFLDGEASIQLAQKANQLNLNFAATHQLAQDMAGGYIDKRKIENILRRSKTMREEANLQKALKEFAELGLDHEVEAMVLFTSSCNVASLVGRGSLSPRCL